MYIKSKHLNVVKSDDGRSFVYHSIYNNPRVFDSSVTEFINFFSSPKSIYEINEKFEGEVDEVIQEFINLSFITNATDNERTKIQFLQNTFLSKVQTGANLSRLELAISNSCNLACPHCMHFLNNDISRKAKGLNMSIDTAKRSIDVFVKKVKEQGNDIARIHFGNGEPLLNWETLIYVLEYCSNINEISFSYAINTNLILLTRAIAETLKEYNVKISTSLDGTEVANNLVRVDKNGNGTFARIIEKFTLLKDIGYPLDGFSITATDKNFNYINEDIIDLAKDFDIKEISLDYDLVSSIDIPIIDCVSKIINLRKYAKSHNIRFYGNWETPFRILMSSSWLNAPHAYCPAMEGSTLEFNIDGSIKTCGHTNTVVGNDYNINDILKPGSEYINLINSRLPGNNKRCFGCIIEGACAGQCHVTIESARKDNNLMVNMCQLMRHATIALIQEYLEI